MQRYETEEAMNLGNACLQVHRYKESEEVLLRGLSRARESGLEQILVEVLNALSRVRATCATKAEQYATTCWPR
jgi:hypothetical protein